MLANRTLPLAAALIVFEVALARASAQSDAPLRPLSPDRPNLTESPHTVDAGCFQLEMDFLLAEREDRDVTFFFVPMNLKIGVASFLDLEIVLRPLVARPSATSVGAGSGGVRELGYADPVFRAKIALLGNDRGPFALGLLPFVQVPIEGSSVEPGPSGEIDRAWEGGVALPMAAEELPWELSLGAMVAADAVQDDDRAGHHLGLLATITVERPVVGSLSAGLEVAVRARFDDDFQIPVTLDAALLYAVHDDLVLDAGAFVGVTRDAPEVVAFAGITSRIAPRGRRSGDR